MSGFAKANTRIGFAQVERNHMSGEVEGRVFAQYPADTATMGTVIENGRFAKYDGVAGKVDLSGNGEWMMIYNEEMLYDERKQNHKDFALVASNFTSNEIVPRLISVEIGDIFTTNAVGYADDITVAQISAITDSTEAAVTFPTVGTKLYINPASGYLTATVQSAGPVFEVIKPFQSTCTMADMQPAVKLMRIQ